MNNTWWKGERGEWYVVLQFILFGIIFVTPFVTPQWSDWDAPWGTIGRVVGGVLLVVGGLLAVAGVANLGRNLAAVPHPKDDAEFVARGAYCIVRHPIYSGVILGAMGWGLFMNSLLTMAMAAGLFIFFDIKSRREELWLGRKFSDYADYQRQVRKLIPFIY